MIKNFTLVIFSIFVSFSAYSQNIKTGVLVVGATPAGMAAAIQSAKSGVKTVLIDARNFDFITLSASDRSVKAGIYSDLIKHIDSLQKFPSTDNQQFTPAFVGAVFKGWTDTIKNLTLLSKSSINKIEKTKKGWEIDLNNREIKADVILDATTNFSVSKLAMANNVTSDSKPATASSSDKLYRTSVAIEISENGLVKNIPLSSFIFAEVENMVLAGPVPGQLSISTGQAAGAIAAYCSFFNTSTTNVDVRKVQGELLTFKARIIAFEDIANDDSSMISIQHLGVTGLIKAKVDNDRMLFLPKQTISTDEIVQPFREYYSRSQIWFLDHKSDSITLEDALSLIKFSASRGKELDAEVQKGWKTSLKFTGDFDLKKVLTRKEFAVLLDRYLQPFNVSVDLSGNVRR